MAHKMHYAKKAYSVGKLFHQYQQNVQSLLHNDGQPFNQYQQH